MGRRVKSRVGGGGNGTERKKGQRLCDQVSKRLVLGVDLKRGQGKIVGRLSRTCVCTFGHSLKSVSLRAGGIRLEETNSHLTVSQRFSSSFAAFLQVFHQA